MVLICSCRLLKGIEEYKKMKELSVKTEKIEEQQKEFEKLVI